jgi:hypothetical protein
VDDAPLRWSVFSVCAEHVDGYRLDPTCTVCTFDEVLIEETEKRLIKKPTVAESLSVGGTLTIRPGSARGSIPVPTGGQINLVIGNQTIAFPTQKTQGDDDAK